MHQGRFLVRVALSAAAAIAALAATSALAQTPVAATADAPAPKCAVAADLAQFDQPLTRTAMRLSGGLPIKIVAIGSSSTGGAGASSPANTYPSRLEVELGRHF